VARLSKGCDYGQDVPALLAATPGVVVVQQQRHLAGTLLAVTAAKQA
jgi:hypothetical protein